jgi:hypothetical protein
MTKAALKEREPALDLGMKDVTPKKQAEPSKAKSPTAKPTPAKPQPKPKNALAVRAPAKPPANVAPLNMLAVLANAASDPKCEPAKMRELYAIHKEMAQDQAKIDFIRDFAALQSENLHIDAKGHIIIPPKDGKRGQDTAYAKFNDIIKAIKPLLQRHHFTLSFATEPSTDASRLIVKGFLDHKGGHQRSTAFPLPAEVSGSKNNVQGWGSSMSYGKRYCTIALLNITSEAKEDADKDGFGEAPTADKITEAQAKVLIALVDSSGVGGKRFCEKYGLEKVADLSAKSLAEATKALENFAGNNKAK